MARDWHSGGEMDTSALALTDFQLNAGATTDTTIKHGGLRSIKFSGQGFVQSPVLGAGAGLSIAYEREYIYLISAPAATTAIMGFNSLTGLHQLYYCLRPDRQLEIRANHNTPNLVAGPSGWTLALNQWYRLELFVNMASASFNGKIDGSLWAGGSFTPESGILGTFVGGPHQASLVCHIDDMAVNSPVGPTNSYWCGEGQIYMLVPGKDFFQQAGWSVQPSGSLIEAMNDLPGPIDDTNYIRETAGTYGNVAGWFMTDMPVSGAVSAMLWGVRGGSTVAAPLISRLDILDVGNRYVIFSEMFDLGINGWKTVYPAARAESVWDGTSRMLSASTSFVTGHQARATRATASANPMRWSVMWCNVEVAMPLTPTTHPTRWAPRSLTELETGP